MFIPGSYKPTSTADRVPKRTPPTTSVMEDSPDCITKYGISGISREWQRDKESSDFVSSCSCRFFQVKEIRSQLPNVVYLSGGDYYQGTVWYTMYKWEVVSKYVNILNHTAMVSRPSPNQLIRFSIRHPPHCWKLLC